MPNWCNNSVAIYHDDPAMIERVRNAFNDGRLLDEFIPVPQELRDTVSGHCGDGYAQELNQIKMGLNVKYFGAKDWYDFCVNKWGTKWDVGGGDVNPAQDIPGGLMLGFDSAWSPPCAAYEKLMEQGFRIRAMYYEGGMAFAGIWEDGADDYYELSGMSSQQVIDELPEQLDEGFGISESIAEYESENAEEEE